MSRIPATKHPICSKYKLNWGGTSASDWVMDWASFVGKFSFQFGGVMFFVAARIYGGKVWSVDQEFELVPRTPTYGNFVVGIR